MTLIKSNHIPDHRFDTTNPPESIRDVRLSRAGKLRLALPICAILAAIAISWIVVGGRYHHLANLGTRGRIAEGLVTEKHRDSDYRWLCDLSVTYSVTGHAYHAVGHVTGNQFAAAVPGVTTVPITYLPANPDECVVGVVDSTRISDQIKSDLEWVAFVFSISIGWLGIVLFMTVDDLAFARKCLTTNGHITNAYYKSYIGTRNVTYPPQINFTIEFNFKVGKHTVSHRASVDQAFYFANQKGEPITVYYDPDKPDSCRIEPEMRMVVRS